MRKEKHNVQKPSELLMKFRPSDFARPSVLFPGADPENSERGGRV